MRSTEFACWRGFLGLPAEWCASQFGCTARTIASWERRDNEIPTYAITMMKAWIDYAATIVGKLTVAGLGSIPAPLDSYAGDDLAGMPPSWHRMIAARVAERTGDRIYTKGSGVTIREVDQS